jgi:hypothetical protein
LSLSFLNTGGLAKYYRQEPGADFIERLFADTGTQRVISRLSTVEMESAFATKSSKPVRSTEKQMLGLMSDRTPRNQSILATI